MSTEEIAAKYPTQKKTPIGGGKPPVVEFVGAIQDTHNIRHNIEQKQVMISHPTVMPDTQIQPPSQPQGRVFCDLMARVDVNVNCLLTLSEQSASTVDVMETVSQQATEDSYREESVAEGEEQEDPIGIRPTVLNYPSWVEPYKVTRMRGLRCYEMVREMVLSGSTDIDTARAIHANGEQTQVKLDGLRQYVAHFRATLPKWEFVKFNTDKLNPLMASSGEKPNVTDILSKTLTLANERVQILLENERKFRIISQGGEKVVESLIKVAKAYHEMEKEVGKGEPETVDEKKSVKWSSVYGRESVAKVMVDTESRVKTLKILERSFDLYSQHLKENDFEKWLAYQKALEPNYKEAKESK